MRPAEPDDPAAARGLRLGSTDLTRSDLIPPTLACQSVGRLPLYRACARAAVAWRVLVTHRFLCAKPRSRVRELCTFARYCLSVLEVCPTLAPWNAPIVRASRVLATLSPWKTGKSFTQSSCEPSGCPARSWRRFTSRHNRFTSKPRPDRDKPTRLSVAALVCLFGLSLVPNTPGRTQTCVSWSSRACFRFATPQKQPQQRRSGSQLRRLSGSAHHTQQPRTRACVTCGYEACPCTLPARAVARRAWRFSILSPSRCGTLRTRRIGWASSIRACPAKP